MSLKSELSEFFKERGKLVIIGVGNPLRGDDGAGIHVLNHLKLMDIPDVLLLNAETVPEAFTSKITGYNPTHVLIVDSANFHGEPGEAKLINSEQIGGSSISTHSLPLTLFINYIEKTIDAKVRLLGIQPKQIEFNTKLSPELEKTIKEIIHIIGEVLNKN